MKEISYRVMRTHEFEKGKSIYYQISCDCSSHEHSMDIGFEFDGTIEMFLYKTIYWKDYYRSYSWYCKLWKRISASMKLLFGGYVEMQGDFLLYEEEHIDAFIEALEEGKKKIKSWTTESYKK